MVTLKNNELTVRFSEFGGSITSIKDKDGVEYLWQGDAKYGVVKLLFCFQFVVVYVWIVQSISL